MNSGPSNSRALQQFLANRDAIYAYVLACVRSHVDADDIMQNVSLAVITAEEAPDDDRRFLVWTREIARRRMLEFFRTSRRTVALDSQMLDQVTAAAERADAQSLTRARRESLLKCLENLPPESRQLLAARYDGLAASSTALAQRFGRSEQGIASLLYRIRQVLRDCVERKLRLEEV